MRRLAGRKVAPDRVAKDPSVDRIYWMSFNAAYMQAAARYRPKPYDGRITLYLARSEQAWGFSRWRLKWQGLAQRGIQVHPVDGTHADVLYEPYVEGLAAHLKACLERCDGA
jgi:thioesterase domain-containing protein